MKVTPRIPTETAKLAKELIDVLNENETANAESVALKFFNEKAIFISISESHPFFAEFMAVLCTNKNIIKGGRGTGDDKMKVYAYSFALLALTSFNQEIALDTFVKNKPELKELFKEHTWLTAFCLDVSKIRFAKRNSLFRVIPGLIFSIFDHYSDLTMIAYYNRVKEMATRNAMISILVVSSFFQFKLTTHTFNEEVGKKGLLKELVLVLLGMGTSHKAVFSILGVKDRRLKEDWQNREGNIFMMCKVGETLFENLPTLILQFPTITKVYESGEIELIPLVSFSASCLAWAFTHASLASDMCSNPRRNYTDSMRDVLTDETSYRTWFFLADFLREFVIIAIRVVIFANLSSVGVFWYFTLVEFFLVLILLHKVRRVPIFFNNPTHNQFQKVFHNVRMLPSLYHLNFEISNAYLFGGMWWSLGHVWNIGCCFLSINIGKNSNNADMQQVAVGLSSCLLVCYLGMFASLQKGEARNSHYWGNLNVREHFQKQWERSEDDYIKQNACETSIIYSAGYRDDIERWFKSNYVRWRTTMPEFLTPKFLSFLDEAWIEAVEADNSVLENVQERRRRRSSVRLSIREAIPEIMEG